ncbi:hypothetical protein MA16_Dca008568 [Dendrobium catenatum]|uniref:Uncharacterized protein n=1 Tax=Dendrobium catenatum TaxID=906689 RepID=A0A2I0WA28_9ASPA|nr:hypothetical protein MA16_Dca008568 [Dendrobium catenatum]
MPNEGSWYFFSCTGSPSLRLFLVRTSKRKRPKPLHFFAPSLLLVNSRIKQKPSLCFSSVRTEPGPKSRRLSCVEADDFLSPLDM